MSILKYLVEGLELVKSGDKYIGQCNKIRCNLDNTGQNSTDPDGEKWWEFVMGNKKPVSQEELVAVVGSEDLADEVGYEPDELDSYFADAQREDPDFGTYKSVDPDGDAIYFIQHAGFEFFWRKQ